MSRTVKFLSTMKIVIWTGGAFESWGYHSISYGGIGGSETAAIRMAVWLAERGHEVEIWGWVEPEIFRPMGGGQVRYLGGDGSVPTLPCDVFISSRELDALSKIKPKCRLSVLWMYDAHVGDDWQNLMSGYDLVFCLSKWARSHLAGYYDRVPIEKLVQTRNAIEPKRFLNAGEDLRGGGLMPVQKTGNHFIYSSSPDRGLGRLLTLWPQIKDKIPDAELHVYYGFDNLRAWHDQNPTPGNVNRMVQVDYLEHRLDEMQKAGVHPYGRVGQDDLAKAFRNCIAWLYPTSFCETFCITALEAQAAECWPITTRIGALPETVMCGQLVDDPQEKAYDRTFVQKVVDFANDVDGCRTATKALREDVRRRILTTCTWQSVAAEWEEIFSQRLGIDCRKDEIA